MHRPDRPDIYQNPDLARFYDYAHGWHTQRADFDYCVALAKNAESVLDLGCGTGELAASLTSARRVTGVDPAAPMLEVARLRPGGTHATWVQADAQTVRLAERFDLIVLTGHAFQVFLTDADQSAVLATIADHLTPTGRFIFDSRNPDYPDTKERTRDETFRVIQHPDLGAIDAWNESSYDTATCVLTYTNTYRAQRTGETSAATAQIRYTPQGELAAMISDAGLAVEGWLGDWHGNPYHAAAKDIIPLGRLA